MLSGNFQIGCESAKCFEDLVSFHADIASVFVVRMRRPKPLQERLALTPDETVFVNAALDTRAKLGVPFWDALMLAGMECQRVPTRLLDEMRFHQTHHGDERQISRDAVLSGSLREFRTTASGEEMACILSSVILRSGAQKHWAFVDFHLPVLPANTELMKEIAKRLLRYPALIIESGASYHLVGTRLIEAGEFRETLARAFLFGPAVDRAYVAHQLVEERAALRLSQGGHKNIVPRLLAVTS